MTTSSVNQPPTASQTLSFEHALSRAASTYEGHVEHAHLGDEHETCKIPDDPPAPAWQRSS